MKKIALLFLAVCVLIPAIGMAAPEYTFVRIENLPEQEIGERLLKEVYKRAGIEIEVEAMSGVRALEAASSGEKDGEALRIWSVGEKYPSLIRVPTPLSALTTQAFVRKDSNITLSSPDELKKFSIVITRGVAHTKDITAGLENVHEVPSEDLLMPFVEAGRAELALTSLENGMVILKNAGINDVVPVEKPLKIHPLYHYVNEKNKNLVEKIDAVIKEMTASGELEKLQKQYAADILKN